MKTVLLLSLFILAMMKTNGQGYVPIPAGTSSQWRVQTQSWEPNPWWMVVDERMYFFEGDTIIGAAPYSKLYASGSIQVTSSPGSPVTYYAHEFKGGFRNDDHKVYYNLDGTEYLLYDFTMMAGDYLPVTFINDTGILVTAVDSVLVGTQYRKRFNLEGPPNGSLLSHWIIEGLGHEYGLIEKMYGVPDAGSAFECYAEYSIPAYPPGVMCDLTLDTGEKSSLPDPVSVSPNPSVGRVMIRSNDLRLSSMNFLVFTITGQKVAQGAVSMTNGVTEVDFSSLEHGVYFMQLTNLGGEPMKTMKLIIQK
jgi:hypothetical protein